MKPATAPSLQEQLADGFREEILEDLVGDRQVKATRRLVLSPDVTGRGSSTECFLKLFDLEVPEEAIDLDGDLPALLVRGDQPLRAEVDEVVLLPTWSIRGSWVIVQPSAIKADLTTS